MDVLTLGLSLGQEELGAESTTERSSQQRVNHLSSTRQTLRRYPNTVRILDVVRLSCRRRYTGAIAAHQLRNGMLLCTNNQNRLDVRPSSLLDS